MWIPHRLQQGSNGISSEVMKDSLYKEGADGRIWLWEPHAIIQARKVRAEPNLWQWDEADAKNSH